MQDLEFDCLTKQQNDPRFFLKWSRRIRSIIDQRGNCVVLDPCIKALDELLKEGSIFPAGKPGDEVTASMFSALILRQARHPDFNQWFQLAKGVLEHTPDMNIKLQIIIHFSHYYRIQGSPQNVTMILDSLQQLLSSHDFSPLLQIEAKLTEAQLYASLAEYSASLSAVSEGLKLGCQSEAHEFDWALLCRGGISALCLRNTHKTDDFLNKMSRLINVCPALDQASYHLLIAKRAIASNETLKARTHFEIAIQQSTVTGHVPLLIVATLETAHFLADLCQFQKAIQQINRAMALAYDSDSRLIAFSSSLIAASMLYRHEANNRNGVNISSEIDSDEDKKRSLSQLKRAMSIGASHGFVDTIGIQGRNIAFLCEIALEKGIEVEYVRGIIKKWHLFPHSSPLHIQHWPWPLKVYTFGRFCLARHDQPLRVSRKAQEKPLELLKILIALGGKEVAEEEFLDIIWPDAEGDLAHRAFSTTLCRLRQYLGVDHVIETHYRALSLNPRYCRVDVWVFERALGKLEDMLLARPAASDQTLADVGLKTVQMYQGPFLGNDSEKQWAASLATRLQNRLLRLLSLLGDYFQKRKTLDLALFFYDKGFTLDARSEALCKKLMNCHALLGNRSDAIKVYEQLKWNLLNKYGIEPSSGTKKLYSRIL